MNPEREESTNIPSDYQQFLPPQIRDEWVVVSKAHLRRLRLGWAVLGAGVMLGTVGPILGYPWLWVGYLVALAAVIYWNAAIEKEQQGQVFLQPRAGNAIAGQAEGASMDERIERIRRKIAANGKDLNGCLDPEQVEAFEERHGIRLPEEYREFLLKVGNGGEGPPYYGVPRLGEAARDMGKAEVAFWTNLPRIQEPFPFTKSWVWENGEEPDEGTGEQVGCGSIYVGNDGCGQYWHLIVTGPGRGMLWQFSGEGIQPTDPPRDFLRWYEDWLDGVEDWWSGDRVAS